jgi:para-nitrobenzyl esterase
VNVFLGIPYAAPPVGKLRWRPPEPAQAWEGVLDASQYANTCPQVTELGAFAGPPSTTEDCLYLNVFTTGDSSSPKRPVIVWIHGGGNVDGESNDYDGSKLAKGGPRGSPTVVVTLNYRLGLFGFLSLPSLNHEGHMFGNYGIMDTQAVLQWVQRNIGAFGGDPTRVTLGGQSAGAVDTVANMISPLSAGLFHRAIPQSSPVDSNPFSPLSVANEKGKAFAKAAGCGDAADVLACLRKLSAARILQLEGTPNASGPYVTGTLIDGTVIPIMPAKAWTTGQFNRVPVMGGSTYDEATFLTGIIEYFSGPPQAPMTADQYTASVNATFSGPAGPGGSGPAYPPGTAAAVLAHYPLAAYASPSLAFDRVMTDSLTVGPCRSRWVNQQLSKWVPVWAYEFKYQNAPYYFPEMPGFDPLAAHTIDIQFIFKGYHGGNLGVNSRGLTAKENALSDVMVAAWTNFARTGNPNGSGSGPWAMYTTDPGAPAVLSEDTPPSMMTDADFAAAHQCDFWDTILVH